MGQRLDEAPIVGRLGACLAAILFIAGSSAQAMAQQHYLCFFDRSSHEISQRCSQIMEEFVRAYARAFGPLDDPNVDELPYVTVEGHADTLEAMRNGLRLSESRARAVAEELVNKGLPRWVLTIRWFGAEMPLVPTPRETSEPQNRRVFVVVR